jgi:hypothetical protein
MKAFPFLFLLLCCCAKSNNDPAGGGDKSLKILYVGNSLTYTNDLPALVAEIATRDGQKIAHKSMTLPDYAFEDHLNDGKVQPEIKRGGYDFVIGQQGPSALPSSQVVLLRDAAVLADLCKQAKSRFALYMVWPSSARAFDLDNVIASYTNAATQTGALLCPAGLGWKKAWEADAALPLYSADGFHPSLTGSVLAALTVYGAVKEKSDFDFIKYEDCSWKKDLSKAQFEALKTAALKALGK